MTEITVPRLGWSMEQGTFLGWLRRDGDAVRAGEPLYTLEGDKSAQEIEAIADGVLRIAPDGPKEGEVVLVGAVLGQLASTSPSDPFSEAEKGDRKSIDLADGGATTRVAAHAERAPLNPPTRSTPLDPLSASERGSRGEVEESGSGGDRTPITPRARQAAKERGIDASSVVGTGRSGRVRERDVLAAAPAAPRSLRRAIAERVAHAARTTVPVTLTTVADATNLLNLRQQFKTAGQEPVPTLNDFLVKLAALALRAHPALNARWQDGAAMPWDEVNVCLAVDTDAGLLAPVIRHADKLPLRELSAQTRSLIEKARAGKADGEGGTFTVTNLGAFGIDAFTPVINWPQSAILGVGRIEKRPAVIEGHVVARDQVTLSLTFDHRVADGAPAARLLQAVRQAVEHPAARLIG